MTVEVSEQMDSSSEKKLAAFCLLKLGRNAEAISLLEGPSGDRLTGDGHYYFGVAFARQGRIEEAVRCLKEASRQPGNDQVARKALLALMKREMHRKIKYSDWDGAEAALREALDIDPSDAELLNTLSLLGNHRPVTYLKANRRAEAAAVWEEEQKNDPSNGKVGHCLSLLYYWNAQELEGQKKGKEATAAWEGAIRNWVALRYNDGFWTKMQREKVFGKISDAVIETLRRRPVELLSNKISEYQNDYLTQGRTQDSNRMSQLSLKLSAEVKTAEALRQVARSLGRQRKKADMPLVSGAFMLCHIGQLEKAQKLLALVGTTQTNAASTEHLHWCLSPWVLPWVMVQERRFHEAIEHLGRDLKKNPSSENGNDLMAIACLEQGKILAASGDVGKALDVWKSGLAHVRTRKKNMSAITSEAEKAAVREAMRLNNEGGPSGLDSAIQLLEKAMRVTDTQRIRENLSELFRNIANRAFLDEKKGKKKKLAEAKKYLGKALELNPNNGQAKGNMAFLVVNEAIGFYNDDNFAKAMELLMEAFKMAPGDDYVRKQVSLGFSNYGVIRWNQGYRREGDELIRMALQIDPNNEQARKNVS